jgi:two-component system phosphate regulon sensor histidine kinase PhoR
LKAAIHLTDPGALYARQRQRTWWFVALVLVAAATAGVGLFSAHRAFQRQLRLNEMKTNFVSSVSHELRAPIASVRLLAESLDRGTVTDEARRREYFQLMGQECRRLSALIENVLDFARIDQGRKQYEFEPTDLPALVAQTVRLMEPYAAERQVTLKLVQPPTFNLQPALDARAIQQALVNLIDNAVKHSPSGKTVLVSLEHSAEPPAPASPPNRQSPIANRQSLPPHPASALPHQPSAIGYRLSALGYRPSAIAHQPSAIRMIVADEGPGIPLEDHNRIFEPFYRRGSELRRETPGIGIGLSIVRHVVAAHDGRVWVESAAGQGSRFVVELPADAAAVEAPNVERT